MRRPSWIAANMCRHLNQLHGVRWLVGGKAVGVAGKVELARHFWRLADFWADFGAHGPAWPFEVDPATLELSADAGDPRALTSAAQGCSLLRPQGCSLRRQCCGLCGLGLPPPAPRVAASAPMGETPGTPESAIELHRFGRASCFRMAPPPLLLVPTATWTPVGRSISGLPCPADSPLPAASPQECQAPPSPRHSRAACHRSATTLTPSGRRRTR